MPFSNNPQAVYNGMLSGQRQMFLSSSLALAMIGFSHNFKKQSIIWLVKIIGMLILILSIFIGLRTASDFDYYLNNVKGKLPEYIPLDSWRKWTYVSYTYSVFIMLIGLLFFIRQIL
jgi:hypothetical protein